MSSGIPHVWTHHSTLRCRVMSLSHAMNIKSLSHAMNIMSSVLHSAWLDPSLDTVSLSHPATRHPISLAYPIALVIASICHTLAWERFNASVKSLSHAMSIMPSVLHSAWLDLSLDNVTPCYSPYLSCLLITRSMARHCPSSAKRRLHASSKWSAYLAVLPLHSAWLDASLDKVIPCDSPSYFSGCPIR